MSPIFISLVVFIGVTALVIGVSYVMRGDKEAEVEDRLSVLTGGKKSNWRKAAAQQQSELLATKNLDGTTVIEQFISRYLNLRQLFEQADVTLPVPQFLVICGILAAIGVVMPTAAGINVLFAPLCGGFLAVLPIIWLLMRRKRRLR